MIKYIIIIICLFILFSAILIESKEEGYEKLFSKSNEDKNIYLMNTKPKKNDTIKKLCDKVISIISYHEKGGIWKRCYIISFFMTLCIYLLYKISGEFNKVEHYVFLILILFTVLYLYHNYFNYHHFRILKKNGISLISKINKKLKLHKLL